MADLNVPVVTQAVAITETVSSSIDLNVSESQAVAITETVSCDTSLVTITETVMYGIKKIKFVWESGG